MLLRSQAFTPDQLAALAGDYRAAGLDPVEEAIAAFTERTVLHAEEMTQADIDALRAHGLDDAEIFDIVLAASARLFWSRANDAIDFEPPTQWVERTQTRMGEQVFRVLSVGRHFGQAGESSAEA